MSAYSPTTFNEGAAPGISAAELNKIGAGIAAALPLDGSASATAALPVTQALSGATKAFLDLTASDGKRYQLRITTAGAFEVYNVTDSAVVFSISSKGNLSGPIGAGIPTTRNGSMVSAPVYTGANTPSGDGVTTPPTGALWVNK